MRVRIKNVSGQSRRVRIVPKTPQSTITIPDQPTNPTLALDESGALQVCLSMENTARPIFIYYLPDVPR